MRYRIASNGLYIFKISSDSLSIEISDFETDTLLGSTNQFSKDITSIWGDSGYLYVGTDGDGVLRSPISSIDLGTYDNFQSYKQDTDVSSNNIMLVHGNGDYLCVATDLGIDQYNISTGDRVSSLVSGVKCITQTLNGRLYYSVDGKLYVVYNNTSNWTEETVGYVYKYEDSNYTYMDSGKVFPSDLVINDVFVTEDTSTYGNDNNVIFLATNDGVVIIEERVGDELNSRIKWFTVN